MSIPVDIANGHTAFVLKQCRHSSLFLMQPLPVIDIKPVLEGRAVLVQLISPADDIQVHISIPICVEEYSAGILAIFIAPEERIGCGCIFSVPARKEYFSGTPFRSSDKDIGETIPVEIGRSHTWTVMRIKMRHQALCE